MNYISNQSLTFLDLIEQRSHQQPDFQVMTLIRDGVGEVASLTYQELQAKARAIASQLQYLSVPGERALLVYPAGLDFIAAFLGCLYAGIIAVPVVPPKRNQSLERLRAIALDCQADLLLTAESLPWPAPDKLSADDQAWLNCVIRIATDSLPLDLGDDWQAPAISGDTLAFLQYTSGSTGQPKGVMVNHRNLLHNSELIYQRFGHTPDSRGAIWLPHYHDMGLIGGLLQPLYGGFSLVLMDAMDFLQQPFRWLQAISHYRATTSGGPNFAYDLCLRRVTAEQRASLDLSSWTIAFNGSEQVRPDTLDQFADAFGSCGFRREAFYPCYGMAETTLIVTGGTVSQHPARQAVEKAALEHNAVIEVDAESPTARLLMGCGQQASGMQVRVVDPNTLTPCLPHQIGEVWVRGISVAQGYWNRPEQTREVFQAHTSAGEGPFLRTGDLGFLREDGELFITGRLKDVLIIRGSNHYPQDIELTVETSHSALRQGCGAAFALEDEAEEKLVVVHEVERRYLRSLDVDDVTGKIRQAIARHHGLQVYAVVLVKPGSIPKTSSGKIQRSQCRALFLEGKLAEVSPPALQSFSSAKRFKSVGPMTLAHR